MKGGRGAKGASEQGKRRKKKKEEEDEEEDSSDDDAELERLYGMGRNNNK